jgi:hypothetical protein
MTIWDFDVLWSKAKLLVARASEEERDGALFPFWSVLALEIVGRAALAHVHPALLADPNAHGSLLYAFGYGHPERPKSVPAATVFRRCAVIVDDFTEADANGTLALIELRNEELHSGASPFATLPTAAWLADYYRLCQLLLRSFGRDLNDLFDEEEAEAAQRMIQAAAEELESEVKQAIADRRRAFDALDPSEAQELRVQGEAEARARFESTQLYSGQAGKLVPCPACETPAWMTGELVRAGEPRAGEDAILTESVKLPTRLQCFACELDLHGHGRLHAAGLGGVFTHESAEDPASFYNIEFDISDVDLSEYFADDYGNE